VAITVDCNARFCWLDPYEGARLAVAEAAANLAAVGAEPLAVTDCLNFGNPEKPEIMWQFAEAVRGMGDACRALGVPIVSGNVSFYNETDGKAILPTPMIGMVGLLEDARRAVSQFFRRPGDVVALIGEGPADIGGSEYLAVTHGKQAGRPPRLDPDRCRAGISALLELARAGAIRSAHDVSEGGLGACLVECCVSGPEPVGATLALEAPGRADHVLFGEAPSRWVISYVPGEAERVSGLCAAAGAPLTRLGHVGGDRLAMTVNGRSFLKPIVELLAAWKNGFRRVVE
jgi:phosphoribosylformylglycinamidine synthase